MTKTVLSGVELVIRSSSTADLELILARAGMGIQTPDTEKVIALATAELETR